MLITQFISVKRIPQEEKPVNFPEVWSVSWEVNKESSGVFENRFNRTGYISFVKLLYFSTSHISAYSRTNYNWNVANFIIFHPSQTIRVQDQRKNSRRYTFFHQQSWKKWRIDGGRGKGSDGEEKMKWKSRFERKIYDSYIFTVYMWHVNHRPSLHHEAGPRSDIFTTDSSKNDGLPATINTYVSPPMISAWQRETGRRMANVKKFFYNSWHGKNIKFTIRPRTGQCKKVYRLQRQKFLKAQRNKFFTQWEISKIFQTMRAEIHLGYWARDVNWRIFHFSSITTVWYKFIFFIRDVSLFSYYRQ